MHFKFLGCIFLYMTVGELTKYLEDWAPPGIAWSRDNVGLQIGSRENKIQNILLCLELNNEVLDEALNKKCNLIISHHPLIFNPIKKIDTSKNSPGKLLERIIKNDITIYSAHTNLDFTKGGVSFELAKTLGLKNIRVLKELDEEQFKVSVFVPEKNLDKVAEAAFNAGAGIIGEYKNCSFRIQGEGTFWGSDSSNPAVGGKNKFEKVKEIRLEFVVDSWNLNKVVNSVINSHPYEEPAYDIVPLRNKNKNYGEGAIGELEHALNEKDFLRHVKNKLNSDSLRYCEGLSKKIKTVAVCGGTGSDLTGTALNNNADAFITADVKYHTFQDYEKKILLVDAGHYETEIHSLKAVKNKIEEEIKFQRDIKVYRFSKSTNPVKIYKH